MDKPAKEFVSVLPTKFAPVLSRKLSDRTIKKYRATVIQDEDSDVEIIYPRFSKDGQHVADQIRMKDKDFRSRGNPAQAALFGQSEFPEGSAKSITVTEGYYDAMSVFQMTGSKYPAVAVQSASSAVKEVAKNFEYLNSFDQIVFCFDNDEPGKAAAKQCAALSFPAGKVRVLTLSEHKDASDYLVRGLGETYVREWWQAPVHIEEGLQMGRDMWADIENHKEPKSVPYPWQGLNDQTYGQRTSELVLLTAETGVGKTSVCKEIEHNLLTMPELINEEVGVGLLHLEEPNYDTAIGLMSIENNKPYHLPDTPRTTEELRGAFDRVINNERLVIWDHFGSGEIETVLSKIRHMAALGCRYIMVDHLSIIVSDQEGDERKQLDEISTKLKKLTMALDIHCTCVIHVNRQGQVRGSAGPEQVANIVIRLERDKKALDPFTRNITRLSIEKNRFCGRTGPACYLQYEAETGRLREITDPEIITRYEKGETMAGQEHGF